jgi:hypothetical protein
MAIEIGTVNADTSVKIGATTIQKGFIGYNKFYDTYTSILDTYPSAYHAYSLRKLKSTYTGACLRIRRTSPTAQTTEVDLNFDWNNTISFSSPISNQTGYFTNATTLGQFASGTVDGFTASIISVSIWYDQSGNNKNVVASNASVQPRLVRLDAGIATLEIIDGSVGVRFISANVHLLSLADTSTSYNNMSCYALGNSISALTNTSIYGQGVFAANARLFLPQGTSIAYNTTGTFPITGITANVDRLYELICGNLTTSAYSNGVQSSVTSTPSLSVTNVNIRVGGNGSPLVYMNGHIKEILCFVGTPSRTDIENSINSFYSVW